MSSIRIDVHHFFHPAGASSVVLSRIEAHMSALSDKVDALTQKVNDETTIEQSAITLMTGLTAIIADLRANSQADPATLQKLDDLANTIEARKQALVAAITANTPA